MDSEFETDYKVLTDLGADVVFFSIETMEENGLLKLNRNPKYHNVIYRGWMLRLIHYWKFEGYLKGKGFNLLNTLDMYRTTHYYPDLYPFT